MGALAFTETASAPINERRTARQMVAITASANPDAFNECHDVMHW